MTAARSGRRQLGVAAEAIARAGLTPRRHRRHRHHQPARNHPALGPQDRPAAAQRHRLAGPPHRRDLRPPARPTDWKPLFRAQDRPGPRRLLLRHQARLAARPRPRRPGSAPRPANSPSAPSTPGWSGTSPAASCTSPMPATPRAPCSSTSTRSTGTTSSSRILDIPRAAAAGGGRFERRLRRDRRPALCRQHPDRRHRRRPAGRPLRPGLLHAGDGEEHLRHRLLHAHAHRRRKPVVSQNNLLDHRRLADRRSGRVCAGRERLHRRGGGAVAARRARHHPHPPARSRPWPPRCRTTAAWYLVPAFAGLGAPHWDPYARGTIVGLTPRHAPPATSPAPPWRASPSRAPTSSRPWRPIPACS